MPTGPAPTQSAVIVAVPAVEPVVAEHRRRFDPSAPWGVPAHVTVLHPFVHPSTVDSDVVRRLGDAVSTVTAFDCSFATFGWFDRDVLWLAPEPDAPFRALTEAVWRAFPDHPPYGGAYADLAPHLTIGQRPLADLAELGTVQTRVQRRLPVTATIERAQLVAGTDLPGSWHTVHELPLAPAR